MISDKTLLRVAVIVFTIGLFSLFILSQQMPEKVLAVSDIKEDMIGEKISVRGVVENPQVRSSLTMRFIDENNTNIKLWVVMFDPSQEIVNSFKSGDVVVVYGEVNIYRGELEITANKITKISKDIVPI